MKFEDPDDYHDLGYALSELCEHAHDGLPSHRKVDCPAPLLTCTCGDSHHCPELVGPYDRRLTKGE